MTDLQLALLALGAIIIAAVILFNWLQEVRIRRETVRRFDGPVKDVLMMDDELVSEPAPRRQEKAPQQVEEKEVFIERFEQKVEHTISIERFDDEETQPAQKDIADEPEYETEPASRIEIPVQQPVQQKVQPIPVLTEPVVEQSAVAVNVETPETETPVMEETVAVPAATPPASALPPNVDEQIDSIAVITLAQPGSGERLRDAMLPLPQLDKPSQWIGQTVEGLWRNLTKDQEHTRFSRIVASLQLADRAGAVSNGTLGDFKRKADEVAKRLDAAIEWKGQGNTHRYAQELDQFCIEVDVMVKLHLISGQDGQFAGTKLRGLAEAGGMALHDDGMFHYADETSGQTQFTMVNQTQNPFNAEMLRSALVHAVTLQLDVTRVENFPEAFSKMVILARRMEQGLNAKLVDDNKRLLGDAEVEKIRQHLKKIHATMMAHDIVPGSPTALRLFS